MLEIAEYIRKPFKVHAVEVTEENMIEVAQWCNGDLRKTPQGKTQSLSANFIAVRVARVTSPRQSQAFVGDWVLYAGTGYKVYTPKAFAHHFDLVQGGIKSRADQEMEKINSAFDDLSGEAKDAAVQARKPLEELRTVDVPASENVAG